MYKYIYIYMYVYIYNIYIYVYILKCKMYVGIQQKLLLSRNHTSILPPEEMSSSERKDIAQVHDGSDHLNHEARTTRNPIYTYYI